MDRNGNLTGHDYLNKPFIELVKFPDFDEEALVFMLDTQVMTTEQLIELNKKREEK